MENKSKSQTSLGFFEVITESFKITRRNVKVLSRILFLVFVSICHSDFATEYMLEPFVKDLVLQLSKHTSMVQNFSYTIDKTIYDRALDDLRVIVLIKVLCMISSAINILTLLMTITLTSSVAYTAKVSGTKGLNLVFLKSLKRALLTSFYIILLSLGIAFLYLISMTITTILTLNSWALLFVGAITLSMLVCYFYMAALWIVSLVVSVLEEGFSGVKAIGRATDLMKGNRIKASLMMVIFCVAYGVLHQIAIYLTSYNISIYTQMAIRIPLTNGLFTLLTLFMFAVYTIFYHEWKRLHDEKEGKCFNLPIVVGDA